MNENTPESKVFDADIPHATLTISQYLKAKGIEGGVSLDDSSTSGVARLETDQARKYEMGKLVASGGMGAILDAKDCCIRRHVAMKVMLSRAKLRDDQILRFIEEAQITGQLEHPNIVPVHELGVDADGNVFYTMKYVRGRTLKDVLNDLRTGVAATGEAWTLIRLLNCFQRICDAVAFAHSKGVIHRDLKPENIMVGDFGEVLVMDWGLAKVLVKGHDHASPATPASTDLPDWVIEGIREDDASAVVKTMDGAIVGTPHYMSPEQARGDIGMQNTRTDIYALGAILYEILTLRPPVSGSSSLQVMMDVVKGKIADPYENHHQRWPLPAALVAVARRALATDPCDRYAQVSLLSADIHAYLTGFATSAEQAGFFRQIWLAVRRHRAAAMVCLALLIGTFAALTGLFLASRADARRAVAERQQYLADAQSAEARLTLLEEEKRRREAWIPVWQADFAKGDPIDPRLELEIQLQLLRGIGTRPPGPQEQMAIVDGVLVFPPGVESTLTWTEPLGDDIRIEIDVVMHKRNRNYRFSIGGKFYHGYRLVVFPRDDLFQLESFIDGQYHVLARRAVGPFEEGQVAHLVLEKRGQYIRAWLDDDPPIEYLDPMILQGLGHQTFSINSTACFGNFNDVRALRVYRMKAPELVPVAEPVRSLIQAGQYEAALLRLQGLLASQEEPGIVAECAYLRWLCLSRLGHAETQDAAQELIDRFPGSPYRWELEKAEILRLAREGQWLPAAERLEQLPLASPIAILKQAIVKTIVERVQTSALDEASGQHINQALRGLDVEEFAVSFAPLVTLDFLAGLQLRRLWAPYCHALESIEALRGMPLESLAVSNSRLSDLSPLAGMPLTMLHISACRVHDLSPLKGMKLEDLGVSSATLSDLSPLHGMRLKHLSIARANVSDLQVLLGMPLESLLASSCCLSDLSPLQDMPLTRLDIGDNSVADLSPLRGMPLQRLEVGQNRISDISPLRDMPLHTLDVAGNRLRDLSALAGLPLEILVVAGNPIESLEPFVDHPPPHFYFAAETLPDAELARAIAVWSIRGDREHLATQARLLLALRRGGPEALRRHAVAWGNHHYLLVPVPLTWTAADRLARQAGAHLVTLGSADEERFVAGLLPPAPLRVWMGLIHEGKGFSWSNGEPVLYNRGVSMSGSSEQTFGFLPSVGSAWGLDKDDIEKMFILEWEGGEPDAAEN